MKKETVEILVEGGKATGGPPLGPKIGPLGLNINEVVEAINKKTEGFGGMKIPVKVIINPETKQYEIDVGTPPTSALIKREINLEKGSQNGTIAGDLGFEQLLKITEMKKNSLLAGDIKGAIKEVVGTCKTLGLTIDGKNPKQINEDLNNGVYDDRLNKET